MLRENDCKVIEPWILRGNRDLAYLILLMVKMRTRGENDMCSVKKSRFPNSSASSPHSAMALFC